MLRSLFIILIFALATGNQLKAQSNMEPTDKVSAHIRDWSWGEVAVTVKNSAATSEVAVIQATSCPGSRHVDELKITFVANDSPLSEPSIDQTKSIMYIYFHAWQLPAVVDLLANSRIEGVACYVGKGPSNAKCHPVDKPCNEPEK